ncbi:cation-translocating P-type ATPase [Patescibacteria group bacterium]
MTINHLESGLSSKRADQLLKKHGFNDIESKREFSAIKILLGQFKSPLIYILFLAGLITLFLGETTDSTVIFLAVFVNTILGFLQESRAEKSLIALRELIVPRAFVVRDGLATQIEASQIVPGDLVILKTGEKVPADGVVVENVDLHVNEAILTGESMPVQKHKTRDLKSKLENVDALHRVYMGTVVVSGRGKILVTETGMETKMGQIAGGLSKTIEEETPLKKKVSRFSKTLTLVFSAICGLILVEGLLRNRDLLEMFELAVATAVAAIPEGLVISMTVILSLGMQRLLKRKALVRKLLAAETLGGVSVICSDKTGTLTKGLMKVVKADFTDQSAGWRSAILCNNLTNPLEMAMWEWAKNQGRGEKVDEVVKNNIRIGEVPFSSKNKYIATLYQDELIVSGAPEKILGMVGLEKKEEARWLAKLDKYTSSGLRVVGFAFNRGQGTKKLETTLGRLRKARSQDLGPKELGLKWLGFIAFEDPIRLEVKEALRACRKAGIKIKVITGDYRETAMAVLRKLDLVESDQKIETIEGHRLAEMTDEELEEKIEETLLFARTDPKDKIRIVETLQRKGEVVAMMGDGVNDALALKKADIGIVVGEASEVAKETADMVLLDSNFKTIVAAVNEGRAIFENIRGVILYLLSDSFTEVILISVSLLLGIPLPITAVQILWVNLIEDGLPGLALAFEPEEEGLMTEPPRKREESILNKEVKILIFIIGIFTDLLLLGLFLLLLGKGLDLVVIRTVIFGGLAINSLFYVYSCRSLRRNLWQGNIFANKFLNLSVMIGFIMLIGGIHLPILSKFLGTTPLSFGYWAIILLVGIVNLMAIEVVKWLFIVSRQQKNK